MPQNTKISILILTHKRPILFERCVKSVVKNKPDWAEIIVNNDSNDIEEIQGATYHYEKHEDLSNTYRFLWEKSVGKYIYFLEDDDFVNKKFWNIIDDALIGEEKLNHIFKYIPENDIKKYFAYFPKIRGKLNKYIDGIEYINKFGAEHFQLGQVVFYKGGINEFVSGNKIENDLKLFLSSQVQSKIIDKPIYTQTTDGGDNISWNELCTDMRFMGERGDEENSGDKHLEIRDELIYEGDLIKIRYAENTLFLKNGERVERQSGYIINRGGDRRGVLYSINNHGEQIYEISDGDDEYLIKKSVDGAIVLDTDNNPYLPLHLFLHENPSIDLIGIRTINRPKSSFVLKNRQMSTHKVFLNYVSYQVFLHINSHRVFSECSHNTGYFAIKYKQRVYYSKYLLKLYFYEWEILEILSDINSEGKRMEYFRQFEGNFKFAYEDNKLMVFDIE
jgi:hypothetical protein